MLPTDHHHTDENNLLPCTSRKGNKMHCILKLSKISPMIISILKPKDFRCLLTLPIQNYYCFSCLPKTKTSMTNQLKTDWIVKMEQ